MVIQKEMSMAAEERIDSDEAKQKQEDANSPPSLCVDPGLSLPVTSTFLPELACHQESEEEKELKLALQEACSNAGVSLPQNISSTGLFLLENISAAPAFKLSKWLASVRKRCQNYHPSGFLTRKFKALNMLSGLPLNVESAGEPNAMPLPPMPTEPSVETTLWERLGKAVSLDIESSEFSWDTLKSLHHTEHTSSTDYSEDEMNKPLEVTVNSGGVVFFAVFKNNQSNGSDLKEGVAVVKFSSSRMATQSERLGYEFAKHLGVQTPKARVIHNSSAEWQSIKGAAENVRNIAITEGDEMGKTTCTELLEVLELSRCLLLTGYVHGSPLLDSPRAFDTQEAAQKTAEALGRILVLDLVLRNEDRLPCRQLGWRGNSANLLFTEKMAYANAETSLQVYSEPVPRRNRGATISLKERRFYSVDSRCFPDKLGSVSQTIDASDWVGSAGDIHTTKECVEINNCAGDFCVVAIDSGVPRRPPAGKRSADESQYPKLVELVLNSLGFSSNLLYEISGEELGCQASVEAAAFTDPRIFERIDQAKVVHKFRAGFRSGLREMQSLHVFLLTLYQKLDTLLRTFVLIISKSMSGDEEKEESGALESCSAPSMQSHNCQFLDANKECATLETDVETKDDALDRCTSLHDLPGKSSSKSSLKDSSSETASPVSRDNWHGKHYKGNGDLLRSMRLTLKLKDFNKNAKVDGELNNELEHWNESLRTEAIKFCQENGFNTGFFEGSDSHSVVDSYELKVRLEHILERMGLISQAADTERPSSVTNCLFIGGALAARSIHTLQYLGVTHILCLCANELGQSEAQYPEHFEYRNFAICDTDDANISHLFEDTSDFIESVERKGGKILVHCFEGKSRSATVVLAYLMLRRHQTLLEAWTWLKKVHRRAQPNDGFMRTLLDLDMRLHGKPSMDWQQRKPVTRICPICGKSAGLSSSSLKLHLQKSHRRILSGSVDSI